MLVVKLFTVMPHKLKIHVAYTTDFDSVSVNIRSQFGYKSPGTDHGVAKNGTGRARLADILVDPPSLDPDSHQSRRGLGNLMAHPP